jgi:mono/diheme cytochrome c family protein
VCKIMMNRITLVTAVLVAVISGMAAAVMAQQQSTQVPWNACCGMSQWPMMGPGMMGPGMMGHGMTGWGMMDHGIMGRGMMAAVPAPYNSMSNPLPRTRETVERGAKVYEQNCASCHGTTGAGDGPMARTISPPPANLAWLSQMPMVQWDPFMFWTVAEGGAQYGNAMPAFKNTLSKDDIWAVIAYVQARLPQVSSK